LQDLKEQTQWPKRMETLFGSHNNIKKKSRRYTGPNTRQWPRYSLPDVPSVKSINANAGAEMKVINISRGGALLETEVRLPPNTKIVLRVVTIEGVIQITGRVLRSSISSLKGTPKYQSAVSFENPLHILDDLSETAAGSQPSVHGSATSAESQSGADRTAAPDREGNLKANGPILEVSAFEARDAALCEMLKLNDW
jgi:hypothetical protein